MGGKPMAFLFGHGEPFIMAFFLIADSLSSLLRGLDGNPGGKGVNIESRKGRKLELVGSDHIDVGGRL